MGRPRKGETRPSLTVITFKADEDTMQALADLESAVAPTGNVGGMRSYVIRKAILDARTRTATDSKGRR